MQSCRIGIQNISNGDVAPLLRFVVCVDISAEEEKSYAHQWVLPAHIGIGAGTGCLVGRVVSSTMLTREGRRVGRQTDRESFSSSFVYHLTVSVNRFNVRGSHTEHFINYIITNRFCVPNNNFSNLRIECNFATFDWNTITYLCRRAKKKASKVTGNENRY